jgi:hypothetical protein
MDMKDLSASLVASCDFPTWRTFEVRKEGRKEGRNKGRKEGR